MSETPNLKLLYEDEEGLAFVHVVGEKLVIHSHYKVDKSPSNIKKALLISSEIDKAFKEKGIKYLHTWATTPEEENYNELLGYTPTGFEIEMFNYDGPPVYEYVKEL